jgi:hypothetical protein
MSKPSAGGADIKRACEFLDEKITDPHTWNEETLEFLAAEFAAVRAEQDEEAHKALDTYGIARGAYGHSVRYRIGLLAADGEDREKQARSQARAEGRREEREQLVGAVEPVLRECLGYFSAPNFTDRYGTEERLRRALRRLSEEGE